MPKATKQIGLEAVCKKLGIVEMTIRRWVKVGCPHERAAPDWTGKERLVFDLKAVRDWHAARRGAAEPGKMGRPSAMDGAPSDIREAQAVAILRKTVAQAERYEHEMGVRRKLHLPAADVESASVRRLALLKAVLLAIPARAGARCANRSALEVEAFVREEVEGALGALSGQNGPGAAKEGA